MIVGSSVAFVKKTECDHRIIGSVRQKNRNVIVGSSVVVRRIFRNLFNVIIGSSVGTLMELFCQVIIGSSVIYMEPIIGKVAKTETLILIM